MFKGSAARAVPQRAASEETRRQILDTALALFREQGFEQTTIRDIAARAGLSLGAAYYYFKSKEAIVGAYYEYVQAEHQARARDAFAATRNLRERLRAAFHTKIDIMPADRRLRRLRRRRETHRDVAAAAPGAPARARDPPRGRAPGPSRTAEARLAQPVAAKETRCRLERASSWCSSLSSAARRCSDGGSLKWSRARCSSSAASTSSSTPPERAPSASYPSSRRSARSSCPEAESCLVCLAG